MGAIDGFKTPGFAGLAVLMYRCCKSGRWWSLSGRGGINSSTAFYGVVRVYSVNGSTKKGNRDKCHSELA
jgi:hypothetical protein